MRRFTTRLFLMALAALAWPQIALAQWYVNPFIGQAMKIEHPFTYSTFGLPAREKATTIGIAGGTNPFKTIGVEIDFQRINNMFRDDDSRFNDDDEAYTGRNYMQSLTVAAHVGKALGASKRIRPYGIVGGGINFVNIGQEVGPDFETFFNLPLNTQNQMNTCVTNLGANPTVAQVQACNFPLTSEEQKGIRGLLTFGGGVTVKLANHLAAKADVRVFKEVPEDSEGKFQFWRFAVGVVLHR